MKFYKGLRITYGTDTNQPGTVICDPNPTEANPLVEVLWDEDHKIEPIHAEYLYPLRD